MACEAIRPVVLSMMPCRTSAGGPTTGVGLSRRHAGEGWTTWSYAGWADSGPVRPNPVIER